MKSLFYFSLFMWLIFEIANVYFIMPMPGSQEMNSIDLAFFLHSWRWIFRILFLTGMLISIKQAWKWKKWLFVVGVLLLGGIGYATNFPMAADHMFLPITQKVFADFTKNKISPDRLVIGVEHNGEARAYPIEMIGYHHRVLDTVGGLPVFVTYCTVCRTGRVYEPVIDGKQETFRLVGMDHFNAMFEDKTTGTWWRQATGEACAGKLKGRKLAIVPNVQMTLKEWQRIYPNGKVLQWDPSFSSSYKRMEKYDKGNSKSKLTGTDTLSWKAKSWVLGIDVSKPPHVYDWNYLKEHKWIVDTIGNKTLLIMIHPDFISYSAWFVPSKMEAFQSAYHSRRGNVFALESGDGIVFFSDGTLSLPNRDLLKAGKINLEKAPVHQEFWHSWKTFHPGSFVFGEPK